MSKFMYFVIVFILKVSFIQSIDEDLGFVENSNRLSFSLLNVLPQNVNTFYSPLSITYSLYVLLNGANGSTETELKNLLKFGQNKTLSSINSDIKTTLDSIQSKNSDEVTARFANRILLSNSYNLTENFENTIKNDFNSIVDSVNFRTNASQIKDEINDWIKEQTNGKIDRLFDTLGNDTAFVISNALYFKAEWQIPFDPYSTQQGQFYRSDGTTASVQMMNYQRGLKYKYIERLNASFFELPFVSESNTSMIILLPNERNGLNQILKVLDSQTLNNALSDVLNSRTTQLNLTFPKFNLETEYDLKEPLKSLGLNSLFEGSADLSRITGATNLRLSEAIHKAVIKVKENGVEASAALGMIGVPHIWIPPIDVTVDRPFLFLIRDTQSGLTLFLGQVYEPVTD